MPTKKPAPKKAAPAKKPAPKKSAPVKKAAPAKKAAPKAAKPDDLKKIEGVGPKIAGLFSIPNLKIIKFFLYSFGSEHFEIKKLQNIHLRLNLIFYRYITTAAFKGNTAGVAFLFF